MSVRFLTATALTLALIGVLAAGPASALDAQEWNQERVAELATQFNLSVEQLYTSARVESFQVMQRQNSVFLLIDDLKTLRRFSARLARQLTEGVGREQTQPLATRIANLILDIRVKQRSAAILQDSKEEVDTARGQIEAILAYYGKSLPPVASPPTDE